MGGTRPVSLGSARFIGILCNIMIYAAHFYAAAQGSNLNRFAKYYRKMVMAVTTFFTCVSGVFLLAGAGAPGVRVMVTAIFFISFLNLSVYARELYEAVRASRPGGVKPEKPAKPGGSQGKPGGGEPGTGQGGGPDSGGPRRNDKEGERK